MGDTVELSRLAAGLVMRGISRREAARLMHISYSALNKKLRGSARIHPEEWQALEALLIVPDGDDQRIV